MTINIRRDGESELPPKLEPEAMNSSDLNSDCMDSSGMWFAVAAVFALLAAGTIIYRVANDDVRMALSSQTAPVSNLR